MNEIQIYDKIAGVSELKELGTIFAKSGMFGVNKEEQGQIFALQCITERKTPLDMARTYHLVEGKLTMRSDAMLAGFRQAGGKCIWKQFNSSVATALFEHQENKIELSYSIEDAKKAGLVKPNSGWIKNPADMLRARLITKAVRMLAPEIVTGIYTPEEIHDMDESKIEKVVNRAKKVEEPGAETIEVETSKTEPEPKDGNAIDFDEVFKNPNVRKFLVAKFGENWTEKRGSIEKKIEANPDKFNQTVEKYINDNK
jgi:hypothetical protein